jgi:hypothetical protein
MAYISYVTVEEALDTSGKICIPEHTKSGQLAALIEEYIQSDGDNGMTKLNSS